MFTLSGQALSSLPGGLCELLKSLHIHSLKNDEVLLLKDPCRLAEHRDTEPQVGVTCLLLKIFALSIFSKSAESNWARVKLFCAHRSISH